MERVVVQSDGAEGKLHGSTYYPLIDCCNVGGMRENCQENAFEENCLKNKKQTKQFGSWSFGVCV